MIPNNQISILPIYDNLQKQNHRKDYSFGEIFPLITPHKTILPFQRIRATKPDPVELIVAKLKNLKGEEILDITAQLIATGLKINHYPTEGFDVIIYPSNAQMDIDLEVGTYYLEMNDGTQPFYSEIFNMVADLSNYLKIEFWDNENVAINSGLIDFTDNFKFRVYLNTQIGRPDYEFEEEVTKRDGYVFIEKQLSEKTFKFMFYAPEYLCDAMRIIRMMDNITIVSRGDEYTADQFLISPKWQKGGYYADVEAEFQSDTIIKKTGARFIPIDNTDPNANLAKVYIGSLIDAEPSELAIKALAEFTAVKQNFSYTEVLTLGKRFCIAYPASFGDLTEAFVLESFDILSVFNKIEMNFTFGTAVVPMFVYVYDSPITYVTTPNPAKTIHYNFTPKKTDYVVGDSYAGGIVAYIFQPGDAGYIEGETHGLIAAPYDTPSIGAKWSKNYLGDVGAGDKTIGAGKQNTDNILISLGASLQPYYAAYAARVIGIGNYFDWFLPSIDELYKLYLSKDIIGGFDNVTGYWSSTEGWIDEPYQTGAAYCIPFNGAMAGHIQVGGKGNSTLGVRAARYF